MGPNDDWKTRVHDVLWGNGKDGLIVRVDRLEQGRLATKERWALYIAAASPVIMVLPYLFSWLRGQ